MPRRSMCLRKVGMAYERDVTIEGRTSSLFGPISQEAGHDHPPVLPYSNATGFGSSH